MKDGGSFHKHKNSTLIVIIFTFFCFLFLGSKAEAESFCVGCLTATPANCTVSTNCPAGVNLGGVCPTLDDAVTDALADMTLAAETVKIAQGTHTGPGTAPVIDPPFGGGVLTTKTINILGGFNSTCTSRTVNAANTIIMAPGGQRVFDIDAAGTETLNITIDGVTIQNGNPGSGDGGGIRAMATGIGGSLNFTSTKNTYNTNDAFVDGGGLSVEAGPGSATALIDNNTFINNSGLDGGGVGISANSNSIVATFTNNIVGLPGSPNTATADGGGALFGAFGGTVTITNQNNMVLSNTASGCGGIRASASASNLNVTILEDIISGNSGTGNGGGICIEGAGGTATASLEKNIINNNIAGDSGGGVFFSGDGTINLTQAANNMIFKNEALGNSPDGGGGVAATTSGGTYTLKFVNNTIADNDATGTMATGGGILASAGTGGTINMTLPNDIIYFNTSTA